MPTVRLLAVAIALTALLSAPADAATPRVVGGSATDQPWMAVIVATQSDASLGLCGGTLIGRRHVLTAAHCVFDTLTNEKLAPVKFTVNVGVSRLSDRAPANTVTVTAPPITPDAYVPGATPHDVAILPVSVAPATSTLALPSPGDPGVATVPSVFGFGLTSTGGVQSNQLLSVAQPILDPGRCAVFGADYLAESMICAGGVVGQDSCNGDSGGPLVADAGTAVPVEVGLVSYGAQNCADGTPAVYSRLADGPVAAFVHQSELPQAHLAVTDRMPLIGDPVTATASAAGTGPATQYAWDLNSAGTFSAASGPSATFTTTPDLRTLTVRASDTDTALEQVRIAPIDPSLNVTALSASVREGGSAAVAVTPAGNGFGTVTLGVAGAAPVQLTIPGPGTATVPTPNPDTSWAPPRQVPITLSTTPKLRVVTPQPVITVIDDDAPVVRTRVAKTVRRGYDVRVTVPGAGAVVVRLRKATTTIITKKRTVASAGTTTVRLRLSAKQAKRFGRTRPTLRVSWTSGQQAVSATVTKTLARVKR